MNAFKISNLLLILLQIEIAFNFKCGTSSLKKKPKLLKIESKIKGNSITKESTYTPIKIGYDFTLLTKPSSMPESTFETMKSILKEISIEFSKILQVQHLNIDLSGMSEDIIDGCFLSGIGIGYEKFLLDNDIIIFPMFDSSLESEALAAAAPCLYTNDFRPLGGFLLINENLNFNKINSNFYLKNVFLHEITHILGFHYTVFSNLNMVSDEESTSYITSPKVVEKAREHFNCHSLTRIPLENQGGFENFGSHWESRYMLGDYMISTDYPDTAISDITLALLEDTGFYKVNYYSGGLFKFGKDEGCEFFNKTCIDKTSEKATSKEFCDTEGEFKCSYSRTLKSSCLLLSGLSIPSEYQYFSDITKGGYPESNYCPVPFEPHSNDVYFQNHCKYGTAKETFEKMGESSFCFMSSLSQNSNTDKLRPVCYEISCNTKSKQIIITVGSTTVTCNKDGVANIPSNLKGKIECPKYDELCASSINGKAYNDIYNVFTKKAENDGYSYAINENDGDIISSTIIVEDKNEDNNENIIPFRTKRNNDYIIKINSIIIFSFLLLFY